MADLLPASSDVAQLERAYWALKTAAEAAEYVADHDPKLQRIREMAKGDDHMPSDQELLESIRHPLSNPSLSSVIETGIVVTYARPFKQSSGPGGFPLPDDVQVRILPPEAIEFHQEVLAWRDKVAAHSDSSEGTPALLRVDHIIQDSGEITGPQIIRWGGWGEAGWRSLARLANEMASSLREMIKERTQELEVRRTADLTRQDAQA
jgi:hypothetical protein